MERPPTPIYACSCIRSRLTRAAPYWLSGNSISAFIGASSIVNADRYTRFVIDSNTLSTTPADVNQTLSSASLSNPAMWAALRFDGTGRLVGVGATGGGSAINGSCWNSVY